MKRFDALPVRAFSRTPQGGLKVQGNLTRSGIFEYRRADGSVRKEYRPPEEVFTASHLDSFKGAPVTIGHPGLMTPDNWKQHSVGHVSEDIRQDEKYVTATLYVQDAQAIKAIEDGKLLELSCGYDVDLDETPGEANGERYDAVQRNIRGNHVAMGPSGWGRAGKDVALRLDSSGNEAIDYTKEDMPNEVKDPKATEIAASEVNIRVDGQKEIDRLSAENQMLTAKVETLEKAVKDASALDSSRLDSLVEERATLVATAKSTIKDFDPKGKSNKEIKSAVVLAKNPKFKLDDKSSDDYVNAAFEMALTFAAPEAPHASLGQVRADANSAALALDVVTDAAIKNAKSNQDAWKTSNRNSLLGIK